ncbi:uncharacterized protein LOC118750021 [Rhagoletis pomonella]|uniref:uncharacterized protein LOC118750021 n=1 Tax=Rhagoletis pomonella TaxID=28610 RepID=UPI001780C661|nr:uncharacterized protein LOC118750021 [Rhagoletis pomonella]
MPDNEELSKEIESLKIQLNEALAFGTQQSAEQSNASAASQITSISEVKFTQFYENDPELWFVIVESHFEARKITSNKSQYLHTVANLSSKAALQVRELLLQPFSDEKYDKLKQQLISIYSESATIKFEKLISNEPLGDMKPSQALHNIKSLASKDVGDDFIKNLWMKKLPQTTRTVLVASKDRPNDLAQIADRMWEVSDKVCISSVEQTPPLEKTLEVIQQKLDKLSVRLNAIETQTRPTRRETTPHRQRGRSSSAKRYEKERNADNDLCWYHQKLGERAKKCRSPCSLNLKQKN